MNIVCNDFSPYITPSDVTFFNGISVLSTRITVFLCAVALNTGCLAYKLGTPDSRFFFYIWFCIFLVWSAVCFNDMFDDEEEVISIDVPTGGAPLPEITSISTTADGTCNEETTL